MSMSFDIAEAVASLLASSEVAFPAPYESWQTESAPQVVVAAAFRREDITGLNVLVAPTGRSKGDGEDRCGSLKEYQVAVCVVQPMTTQDESVLSPCTIAEADEFISLVEAISDVIESEPNHEVTNSPLLDFDVAKQYRLLMSVIQVTKQES